MLSSVTTCSLLSVFAFLLWIVLVPTETETTTTSWWSAFSLSSVRAYLNPIGWAQWFIRGTLGYWLHAAWGFLVCTAQGRSILFFICLFAVVCYCSCLDDKNEAGEMPKKDEDNDDSGDDDDSLNTKYLSDPEEPPSNAFQRTMRFFAALFKCPIWIVFSICVVVGIFLMLLVLPSLGRIWHDFNTEYFTAHARAIWAKLKRDNTVRDAEQAATKNVRDNYLQGLHQRRDFVKRANKATGDLRLVEEESVDQNFYNMPRPQPRCDPQYRTCLPRVCSVIAEKADHAQHFKWCVSPDEKDIPIPFSDCTFECIRFMDLEHFEEATAMLDTRNSGGRSLLLTPENIHIVKLWFRLLSMVDDTIRDDLLSSFFSTDSKRLCQGLLPEDHMTGEIGTAVMQSPVALSERQDLYDKNCRVWHPPRTLPSGSAWFGCWLLGL